MALRLVNLNKAVSEIKPRDWLIDRTIERGSFFGIIGPPETGKTFIATDLAGSVAAGTAWLGSMKAPRPGKVIYFSAEASDSVIRRLNAWQEYHGHDIGDNVLVPSVSAALTENTEEVFEELFHAEPDLIIIDTWARATPGMNENSADQVSELIRHIDILRHRSHTAVAVIHHTTLSSGRARGSSALFGAFDTEFTVDPGHENGFGFLSQTKVKDGTRTEGYKLGFHIISGHTDGEGNTTGIIIPHGGEM